MFFLQHELRAIEEVRNKCMTENKWKAYGQIAQKITDVVGRIDELASR